MSDRLTSAELRYWRETMHGLSQKEAAELLGLSIDGYRAQETGKNPVSRPTTLLTRLPLDELRALQHAKMLMRSAPTDLRFHPPPI